MNLAVKRFLPLLEAAPPSIPSSIPAKLGKRSRRTPRLRNSLRDENIFDSSRIVQLRAANCIRIRFLPSSNRDVSRYSSLSVLFAKESCYLPIPSRGILTKGGKDQTEFNNRAREEKAAIDLPLTYPIRFRNGI